MKLENLKTRFVSVADASQVSGRLMMALLSWLLAYVSINAWADWSGDYAYYLGMARNMFFDRPLETANVGVVAPSGFPWILSKIAPVLDWNLYRIKLVNLILVAMYLGFVLDISKAFTTKLGKLVFVALAVLNVWIWFYSNAVLTEIPFLVILTAMVWLVIKSRQEMDRNVAWILAPLYFLAFLACTLKGAGLLLFLIPPILYLEMGWRAGRVRWLAIAGLCVLSAILIYLVYTAQWFHALDIAGLSGTDSAIGKRILAAFLKIDDELTSISFMLSGRDGGVLGAVLVTPVLVVAAISRLIKKEIAITAMIGAIAVPVLSASWIAHGGRYWFPLLAAFAFLIAQLLESLADRTKDRALTLNVVAAFLIGGLAINHVGVAKKDYLDVRDRGVFEENAAELFYWVHYNTEWGKDICFYKPRILGYFANWNTVCFIDVMSTPEQIETALEDGADFVVISDHYSPETWAYFNEMGNNRIVYRNEKFLVVAR